jgi:putative NIF3 family GTP cyclohydrolase 1 type 2
MLGLQNVHNIECLGNESHLGRIGYLHGMHPLVSFTDRLKDKFSTSNVTIINPLDMFGVSKVAVIPGAGGSLISKLDSELIDILVTGDVRYHNALETSVFIVADVGHFESERIILPVLKDLLKDLDINVIIAEEKSPWKIC